MHIELVGGWLHTGFAGDGFNVTNVLLPDQPVTMQCIAFFTVPFQKCLYSHDETVVENVADVHAHFMPICLLRMTLQL